VSERVAVGHPQPKRNFLCHHLNSSVEGRNKLTTPLDRSSPKGKCAFICQAWVISGFFLCYAMLCQSTQAIHRGFCRYASDLMRQSICETNCESGVRLHGEASDGAFVERSVVVAVAAGNFDGRISCVPWSPTRSQYGLQGKSIRYW